jgi:hypothetical protein
MDQPPNGRPPEPPGPFGWPGLGRYLRGPEGLQPLSDRRRNRVVRWAGFAAAVGVMIAIFAVLFLVRGA